MILYSVIYSLYETFPIFTITGKASPTLEKNKSKQMNSLLKQNRQYTLQEAGAQKVDGLEALYRPSPHLLEHTRAPHQDSSSRGAQQRAGWHRLEEIL